MRALFVNEIANASSLAMTNPNLQYPVTNIVHPFKARRAQAEAGETVITIVWDDFISVDSFFFGYHNIINFTLKLYDDEDTLLGSYSLAMPKQNDRYYLPAKLTTVVSVEITLQSVSNVFVGAIALGSTILIPNVTVPYTIIYEDTSAFETSDGGQAAQYTGLLLRAFDIVMSKINVVQRNALILEYAKLLKGKPFWLDRYENLSTAEEEPIYGIFVDDIEEVKENGLYTLTNRFREAN